MLIQFKYNNTKWININNLTILYKCFPQKVQVFCLKQELQTFPAPIDPEPAFFPPQTQHFPSYFLLQSRHTQIGWDELVFEWHPGQVVLHLGQTSIVGIFK